MRILWIEVSLFVLLGLVLGALGHWALDAYRTWRINRDYGPGNRRRHRRGRRQDD